MFGVVFLAAVCFLKNIHLIRTSALIAVYHKMITADMCRTEESIAIEEQLVASGVDEALARIIAPLVIKDGR